MSACRYDFTQVSLNNLYNTSNYYFLSFFLCLDRIHFSKQRGPLPSFNLSPASVSLAFGSLAPGRGIYIIQSPHTPETC